MVMFALIYKVETETPTAHISNWGGEIYHQSRATVCCRWMFAAISVDNSVNLRHSSGGLKILPSKAKQIGVNCRDLSALGRHWFVNHYLLARPTKKTVVVKIFITASYLPKYSVKLPGQRKSTEIEPKYLTWGLQQVRVYGDVWEGGGRWQAGQLVDGGGRAGGGGAGAAHVGTETQQGVIFS